MTQIDRINGLIGSIAVKVPCRAATTANITLSGEQTIDGVAVIASNRVLVKNQTITSENGIYDVSATSWSRSTDFDGARDFTKGTTIRVVEGTISIGSNFEVTSSGISVGTSSIILAIVPRPFSSDDFFRATTKTAAAALALTSADAGRKISVTSSDGGWFTVEYDVTAPYADNGGAYCGTVFIPSGGDGTIGFVRDYDGAISPLWFGVVGDGTVDDTTAMFTCLNNSDRVIEFDPEATYLLSGVTSGTDMAGNTVKAALLIEDKSNITIIGNGATLKWSGSTPASAHDATILCFMGTVIGATGSQNIKIKGKLYFDYVNAPSSRVDNNFALFFEGVTGIRAKGVSVLKSWSAGIWSSRCNNVRINENDTLDTKADGITFSGCGRNIRALNNNIDNPGDDGIAVTWFAGNLPSHVGETEAKTINCKIKDNIINGSPDSGRGVFLGGVRSGCVKDNIISSTGKYGISTNADTRDMGSPFYDANGVATESADMLISGNILNDCGLDSNDTAFKEIGGIAIQHQCTAIVVSNNELNNCNNVAILSPGNADILNNKINGVVFSNAGTVNDADLAYKGMGISVGDFSATGLCAGVIKGNSINGVLSRAVWIRLSATDGWHVSKNTLTDCGNVTNSSDTMTINGLIYIDNATDCTIESNVHVDNRASNTIPALVYQGAGGNTVQRDNFPSRIARIAGMKSFSLAGGGAYYYREVAVDPASIASGNYLSGTETVNGALIGDAVTVSPGVDTSSLLLSSQVVAANTVKWTLYNPTVGAVDLASSIWIFRIYT